MCLFSLAVMLFIQLRQSSWQRYCIDHRQQPLCPTCQKPYMDCRLAAGGGPITWFLNWIVAAAAEEDVQEEGRECRQAIVYAAKVRWLTKRIPLRTMPQTRRGRQAQELMASTLVADATHRKRAKQHADNFGCLSFRCTSGAFAPARR